MAATAFFFMAKSLVVRFILGSNARSTLFLRFSLISTTVINWLDLNNDLPLNQVFFKRTPGAIRFEPHSALLKIIESVCANAPGILSEKNIKFSE